MRSNNGPTLQELKAEQARRSLKHFVSYIKPDYQFKPFNEYIISRLQLFAKGEIKRLMVFCPPQHGKTQLTTRTLPAYILGKTPKKKISIASYSATIAHEFARDVKNIINSPEYREVFPKTKVGKSKTDDGSYSDASYYYHTVPDRGFIYSVGRGGSITSKTIDISIIDDPLKGREEALSKTIKEKLWKWYLDDVRTRLHNDSQELVIQTRWAEDDLSGRILKMEADKWEVIIFPVLKTADYSPYDNRQEGEVLFPEKHSLERMLDIKEKSETTFDSLYQQNPKPNNKLLVHPDFVRVKAFPVEKINKWIIGIDYGYVDQVAVVLTGCYENKRYHKTLLYMPGKEIIKASRQNAIDGTPEAEDIIIDAIIGVIKASGHFDAMCFSEHDKAKILKLQQRGVMVYLARKDIIEGISKVNEYENYYLDTDQHFFDEVSTYQFHSIGDVVFDKPVDGKDHIMNAIKYSCYTSYVVFGS